MKLIHGDCLEVMGTLENGSIDCIVTDPPYSVWAGGTSKLGLHHRWLGSILKHNDGKIFEHNEITVRSYISELYRVLKAGGHCYLMVNNKNLREFLNAADEAKFKLHNLLVWKKNNIAANRWYMKNLEYILFFYKSPSRTINNPSTHQVLEFDIVRKREHPTQKPIELMEVLIANSSQPGGVVLDPFMGSGSTGLAASRLGRRFIGIEKDKRYFDIASQRMAQTIQTVRT